MKPLAYRPLAIGVLLLQALTFVAVFFSRWQIVPAAVLTAICAFIAWSAFRRRQRADDGPSAASTRVQLRQLACLVAVVGGWYLWIGLSGLAVAGGVTLLLARNFTRATRRELYFDLGVVLALFYEAEGSGVLAWDWLVGAGFLTVLIFVLVADYIDRRLAYVHIGDSRMLTAVWPGVRGTGFATVIVGALAAAIYVFMPQPEALDLGAFPDRGPPAVRGDGSGDERAGTGAAGGNAPGEARSGRSPSDGSQGAAPGGKHKTPYRLSPDGPPLAGGESGKADSANGLGRFLGLPGKAGSAGDRGKADGGSMAGGGGAFGFPDKLAARQSLGRIVPGDDFYSDRFPARSSKGKGKGPQGDDPGGDRRAERGMPSVPGTRLPGGDRSDAYRSPAPGAGQDSPGEASPSLSKGEGPKPDEPKSEPAQSSAGEGCPPPRLEAPVRLPETLVLLFMDAERPLDLRDKVYVEPDCGAWNEGWDVLPAIVGRRPRENEFVFYSHEPRQTLQQRFRVAQPLDGRLPSAYLPARVGHASKRLGYSADRALIAPDAIDTGTEYQLASLVWRAGGRDRGDIEASPDPVYLALPADTPPRLHALANRIKGERRDALEVASALEAHLRSHYTRASAAAEADGSAAEPAEFLFERTHGDSADFAVAMTTMARALGIPARIVAGYAARRLNPIHNTYEVWFTDQRYWVEAYADRRWVAFQPSPWLDRAASTKPPTPFAAAREYVRLADEPPGPEFDGFTAQIPRIARWYLYLVLAYGWLATYGAVFGIATLSLAGVAWYSPRWMCCFADALDNARFGWQRRGPPGELVRHCYEYVERRCARRALARERLENHAEFLRRLAHARPHVAPECRTLSEAFGCARYGATIARAQAEAAVTATLVIAELLDERLSPGAS